jgi:hypothetical protein
MGRFLERDVSRAGPFVCAPFHQIRFAQKWHSFKALVGICEAGLQKLGIEVF